MTSGGLSPGPRGYAGPPGEVEPVRLLSLVRVRLVDAILLVVTAVAAAEASLLVITLGSALLDVTATGLTGWQGAADVGLPALWIAGLAWISLTAWRRTTWGCRGELDDRGACRRHRGYCARSQRQRRVSP